jgi:hypothetical protein
VKYESPGRFAPGDFFLERSGNLQRLPAAHFTADSMRRSGTSHISATTT